MDAIKYEPNPPDYDDIPRYAYDEFQRIRDALETTPRWDDLRFPATGSRLDNASTRYSYDFVNCGIIFNNNSRYTQEPLCHVAQMPHGWKEESAIRPHIHWNQISANVPNWLISYRFYNNGGTIPAFTNAILSSHAFTYVSGTLAQISSFPEIDMTGLNASCLGDVIIYRDTANASTLFGGADPEASNILFKEFDIHHQVDSFGSAQEFVK